MHHVTLRTVARWALACIGAWPCVAEASEPAPTRQVAIIGAGAAGSSTAYHLQKFASEAGVAVNITIFEKEGRVGGRTLTIDPFGNASQRVELGASIFIPQNYILMGAREDLGLDLQAPYEDVLPIMGVWDGKEFVLTMDESSSSWSNTMKIILKYGFSSPRATQKLVDAVVNKFLKLYEAPYFPFRSLTQRVYDLGLQEATAVTGEQFLKTNGISDLFAHDIIQASTRVNYASNLAYIHGLDTMVSMSAQGATSVDGGNWQIFHRMVNVSRAHLALNTSVTSIATDRSSSSQPYKYILTTQSSSSSSETTSPIPFDNVVLAAPFQFTKIAVGSNVLQHAIDAIPYVQLHVTIFASPFLVSPSFFNLKSTDAIPGFIITTLGKDDSPSDGAGSAGFFSINILRKVTNPKTGRQEYLYKIFSPEKITAEFLSTLFNVPITEEILLAAATTTSSPSPSTPTTANAQSSSDTETATIDPISYYHPWAVHSYPKALPRVTFQDPIVGAGLYYTAGMESFISTMETNALAGKNVARLIVDAMLEMREGINKVGSGKEEGKMEEELEGLVGETEQRVLGAEL